MTTVALSTSSAWNVPVEHSRTAVDHRASVGTWSSSHYAPTVFTFNANWAPAPFAARVQAAGEKASYRWDGSDEAGTFGDGVESHFDFDSDDDSDDNDNDDEEQSDWHGAESAYHAGDPPDPTPTQEQPNTNLGLSQRPLGVGPSDPFADSNAAYLASYGFTDGLGYEHPPPDISLRSRSSSPSSRYSFDNSRSGYASNYLRSNQPLPKPQPPPPPIASSSAWPTSLSASNALLASLTLDISLQSDPSVAWEALCWDEAAPEGDSDSEHEDQTEDNETISSDPFSGKSNYSYPRGQEKSREAQRESSPSPSSTPPSPYPVFRKNNTSSPSSISTTIGFPNPNSNPNLIANSNTSNTATSSEDTSTITAESSEEWVSLTGARAQAARARILPFRHIQVPFPTYPRMDISMLDTSVGPSAPSERTPVDPILGDTPTAYMPYRQGSTGILDDQGAHTERREESMRDVFAVAAEAEGETAPHYGESGRDRLLTLTERDPPPYDLPYDGDARPESQGKDAETGGDDPAVAIPDVPSSSSLQAQAQPPTQIYLHASASATRTRSQLTFPTSPTDSDTLPGPGRVSLSSPLSRTPNSPLSANPSPTATSPTATETTLMTPAGATYFSSLFPPVRTAVGEESSYIPRRVDPSSTSSSPHPFPPKISPSSPSPANQKARPLPPRPIPRTTVGTWLSASAAGPYASGTRAVSGSSAGSVPGYGYGRGSAFSSWGGFGYGAGAGMGSGIGSAPVSASGSGWGAGSGSERSLGWRSPVSDTGFREVEALHEINEDGYDDMDKDRQGTRFPSPFRHPNISSYSEKSHSSDSLVKRREATNIEIEQREGEARYDLQKSSLSVVLGSKVEVGSGTRPNGPYESDKSTNRNRSGSRSGRPLQRLATRCSTLTRRIGIVTGVGGVGGRER